MVESIDGHGDILLVVVQVFADVDSLELHLSFHRSPDGAIRQNTVVAVGPEADVKKVLAADVTLFIWTPNDFSGCVLELNQRFVNHRG